MSEQLVERVAREVLRWQDFAGTPGDRDQIAFLCGYSHKRSTNFELTVGEAIRREWVMIPSPGLLARGDRWARRVEERLTIHALRGLVREKLEATERKIFDYLITLGPRGETTRDVLAKAVGYAHKRSTNFELGVGKLVRVGVATIPRPGHVGVAAWLFPGGTR